MLALVLPANLPAQAQHPGVSRQPTLDRDVRVEQLMIRAMTRSFLGYHDEAIALYEQALQLAPSSPVLHSALADAYEDARDYARALFYAEQARTLDPDNVFYHREYARMSILQGRLDQAAQALETALHRFPDHTALLEDLAELQFSMGRLDEARDNFRRLADRLADDVHVRYRLIELYTHLQDTAGLERTLLEMDELLTDEPDIKRRLAELYADAGRLSEAIALLETAVRFDASDVETITALAALYERAGTPEKAGALWDRALGGQQSPESMVETARRLYEQADRPERLDAIIGLLTAALERKPDLADGLMLLGTIRYDERDYEAAGSLLYRAVQINPRSIDAWQRAATAFQKAGQAARAAEIAEEALLLFPGQQPLLRLAAYGYMDTFDNEKAITYFNALYALIGDEGEGDYDAGEVLSALGLLHTRTGDHAAADSVYRRALALFPEEPVVLNNYAYTLAERGQSLDLALRYARRAVEAEPANAAFLDTLGWVYFKMNRLKEAERWTREAIRTGNASATVYEHLGDIQARQGKTTEAVASWHKSLEMNPGNQRLVEKLNKNE